MYRLGATVVSCFLFLATVAASCGADRQAAPLTEEDPGSPPSEDPPAPLPVPVTGRIVGFPIPKPEGSFINPHAITAGADGHLWFTMSSLRLGRISPADGSVTFFPIPVAAAGITLGADGNLWFGTPSGVARLSAYGIAEEFVLAGFGPAMDVASGFDANIWVLGFTHIARVTTDGEATLFPLPTQLGSNGQHIASGPDGNLWYTRSFPGFVGRITQQGVVTEFPVMGESGLFGIAGGHDGAVWFTRAGGEANDNAIDRVTVGGVVSRVLQLPTSAAMSPNPPDNMPIAITAGPDGNMYYTTYFLEPRTYIGGVTPAGVLTRYEIPELVASFGIASGPDGNIWFTDNFGDKIWRLDPLP